MDGTHLKHELGGTTLFIVGRDSNGTLRIPAFMICRPESTESFPTFAKKCMETDVGKHFGEDPAMFGGDRPSMFCDRASAMKALGTKNKHAEAYLRKVDRSRWIRHAIYATHQVHTYMNRTNRCVEFINGKYRDSRFFNPFRLALAIIRKECADIVAVQEMNKKVEENVLLTKWAEALFCGSKTNDAQLHTQGCLSYRMKGDMIGGTLSTRATKKRGGTLTLPILFHADADISRHTDSTPATSFRSCSQLID